MATRHVATYAMIRVPMPTVTGVEAAAPRKRTATETARGIEVPGCTRIAERYGAAIAFAIACSDSLDASSSTSITSTTLPGGSAIAISLVTARVEARGTIGGGWADPTNFTATCPATTSSTASTSARRCD